MQTEYPESVTVIGNGTGHDVNVKQAVEDFLAGKFDNGELSAETVQERIENGTDKATEKSLAVVAIRLATGLNWSACGQAAGFGDPEKEKAGASSARQNWTKATGLHHSEAPEVVRQGRRSKTDSEEEVWTHKGGGVYENEDGETVKGKKNLPENSTIVQAA